MYYILQISKFIDRKIENKSILQYNGSPLYFETKQDAIEELLWRGIDQKISPHTYTHDYYVTRWGEYDKPIFKIRKVRSKK